MSIRDLLAMPLYASMPVSVCATPSPSQPIGTILLGTVNSLARMISDETNRELARANGREYRERELKNYEEFGAKWKAKRGGEPIVYADDYDDDFFDPNDVPTILHTFEHDERIKPLKVKVAVRRAMEHGYKVKLRNLRKHQTDSITFSTSAYMLLKAARLSDSTSNYRAVIITELRRLRKQGMLTFEATDGGDLVITVLPACLRQQYHRLPLPLPTRSKLALQLLLWFQHARPKKEGSEKRSVSISHLRQIFQHDARLVQAVQRALVVVNAYLRPLSIIDALADELKIKLPGSYSFKVHGADIRFASSTETVMNRKATRRRVIVRERLEEPEAAPAYVPVPTLPDTRPPIYRVPLSRMDDLEDHMEAAGFKPCRFEEFAKLRDPMLIDLRDRLTLQFLGQEKPRRTVQRERL